MLNESEHKVYLSRYTQKVDLYIKRPPTGETFITTRTYSIDPFTVLTTIFDWDKLAKIRYHGRKESVKCASTKGPGRGGTSHLTDFDETWPV